MNNNMLILIFLSMMTTISVENTLLKLLFSGVTVAVGISYVRTLEKQRMAEKNNKHT